jgi:hypothetical protein
MNKEAIINKVIKNLEQESMYNFNGALPQRSSGFDSEASGFDSEAHSNMSGSQLGSQTDYIQELQGCNTYGLNIVYSQQPNAAIVRAGGTPPTPPPAGYLNLANGGLPVNITLFQKDFNFGGVTNSDGSVTFTNSQGDTATIFGKDSAYAAILSRSATQPLRIRVLRMQPQNEGQFLNPIRLNELSVYGKNNSNPITPDVYRDPYVFQTLKADVPLKFIVSADKGFSFDVNALENIGVNLFIDMMLDIEQVLKGQTPLRGNSNAVGALPQRAGNRRLMTPAASPGAILHQSGQVTIAPNIAQHPLVQKAIAAAASAGVNPTNFQ